MRSCRISLRQWYTIIPDTVIQRALKNAEDNGDERSILVQKTGNYEDRLSVAINCLLHDDDDYQNFYSYNTSELYSGFIL